MTSRQRISIFFYLTFFLSVFSSRALSAGTNLPSSVFQIGPTAEIFFLPEFYRQSADLSSYLSVKRKYDGRVITSTSLQSYTSNQYDTNDFRLGNVRSNNYDLEPLMWGLGVNAQLEVKEWFTLFATGLFFLGGDQKSFLQRFLLAEVTTNTRYNGVIRAAANDTGVGSGLLFEVGARFQNKKWKLFQMNPFAGVSWGAGALLEYRNTTRMNVQLQESVSSSAIQSFTDLGAAAGTLSPSLTEEWTLVKSFGGFLTRGKLEMGLEYELSESLSASLSGGVQLFGLFVEAVSQDTLVNRAEYGIPKELQAVLDPFNPDASYLEYPGTSVKTSLPGFTYFRASFFFGLSFTFRPTPVVRP